MNKQMAGILTAALLLASCTGGDGNANPTASTATTTASATATTTPSPSPSTTSAEDQAAQHAEAVYRGQFENIEQEAERILRDN